MPSLFLTAQERKAIATARRDGVAADLYWALLRRTDMRAAKPGLLRGDETADWWRPTAEYLTEAAMAQALRPDPVVGAWLRDVTLALIRRPQDDWVGPAYRNHTILADGSQIGHLETAHFCWAVAIVLDLAGSAFTDAERDEIVHVLKSRGMHMCINWLDRDHSIANWWCILTAGLAVAAAVLDDEPALARAREELQGCARIFQHDGSSGESLQYGNYALYGVSLAVEALSRRGENVDEIAPVGLYAGYARWAAASYLYSKPTTGWGPAPKPRSLNFNDSGAVFKPSAEVLLHIAARAAESHPTEAGLARWLFDETYADHPAQGPLDQASFGLRTGWGFLTLPLLTAAAEPVNPADALPKVAAFACGDSIARDAWNGRTVFAMHGGGEPLNGPNHLHRDLNTIILVHREERLIADIGHSCYRNVLRDIETSTGAHNTCVFLHSDGRQIEQVKPSTRKKRGNVLADPVDRGAHRLIATELEDVRVVASDAAAAYGSEVRRFARFCILCGSGAIFVVDYIDTDSTLRTRWNWLMNNRDGELDLKLAASDRIVARRGNAGMKLFSLTGGGFDERFAHLNDAYHCLPGQLGEGRPGSGVLLSWTEPRPAASRVGVHAIAVDSYGRVASWHLRQHEDAIGLEAPEGASHWTIAARPEQLMLHERVSNRRFTVQPSAAGKWLLQRASTGPEDR